MFKAHDQDGAQHLKKQVFRRPAPSSKHVLEVEVAAPKGRLFAFVYNLPCTVQCTLVPRGPWNLYPAYKSVKLVHK